MGDYLTTQDLLDARLNEDKLAELSQHYPVAEDEGGDYPLNEARVEAVIAEACALIDLHLRNRVSLPVTDADALDVLKGLAASIADHLLHRAAGLPNEEARTAYEDALKLLKDIAAGRAVLPGSESAGPAVGSSVDFSAATRLFTADTMGSW